MHIHTLMMHSDITLTNDKPEYAQTVSSWSCILFLSPSPVTSHVGILARNRFQLILVCGSKTKLVNPHVCIHTSEVTGICSKPGFLHEKGRKKERGTRLGINWALAHPGLMPLKSGIWMQPKLATHKINTLSSHSHE